MKKQLIGMHKAIVFFMEKRYNVTDYTVCCIGGHTSFFVLPAGAILALSRRKKRCFFYGGNNEHGYSSLHLGNLLNYCCGIKIAARKIRAARCLNMKFHLVLQGREM